MNKKPIWIAHRGYKCSGSTENTINAFKDAVRKGFDFIETDLRLTADNNVVLCHDPSLKRVSGIDKIVHQSTTEELRGISLTGSQNLAFFDEFAAQLGDIKWILDIKEETAPGVLEYLFQWAEKNQTHDFLVRNCRFLFWQKNHQKILLEKYPEALCFARKDECWSAALSLLFTLSRWSTIEEDQVYSIPPQVGPIQLFKEGVLEAYKKNGARTLAFLPRNNEETQKAVKLGFDLILTDGEKE